MRIILLPLLALFTLNTFPQNKGYLVIIGGGERPVYVMERMTELAGGGHSKIIVIPNASSEPQRTAEYQSRQFKDLGAGSADYILFDRESADDDSNLQKLDGVTGIFFSGGDQSNITRDLLGTKLLGKIYSIYNSGGVIGGTSAGAAIMSELMLTGNELLNKDSSNSFISIQKNNIEVKEGLGFIRSAIVDQHFIKRKRHNRLISLVLEHPELPGIAIDEETAIVVGPDDTFEVLGESQVLIYDAGAAANIKTDKSGNLSASDIKMHILVNGDRYDLKTKKILK